jgi:hypothetical protein
MSTRIRSVSELADRVARDPQLAADIRENPEAAIARVADGPLDTDNWIYRIVVLSLGLALLGTLAGLIALSWKGDRTIPDGLVAIGSAAVGALAGLLAPSPRQ